MKRISFPLSVLSMVAIVLSPGQLPAQSPAAIAGRKISQAGAPQTELAGPKSGLIATLLRSRQGRLILKSSQSPLAQALRKRLGVNEVLQPGGISDAIVSTLATSEQFRPEALNSNCGAATGTRFNLEPRTNALPQDSTSVDFLPNAGLQSADLVVGGADDFRGFFNGLGNSASGYYVHRNGQDKNPCFPDFEGGLPSITDPNTSDVLLGSGSVVVESDPVRNSVFMADSHNGSTVSAIGVFRSRAATLNDAAACPNGTHAEAQAKTCWPVSAEVTPVQNAFDLAPRLAVDQREVGRGMGAGDVYASFLIDAGGGAQIVLAACKNDLSACSPPVVINGADTAPTANYLRIRPDIATHVSDSVTVTYENVTVGGPPDFLQTFDIKYVTCTPQGAPAAPVCSGPKLVTSETQPIPSKGDTGNGGLFSGALAASQFVIATGPKHEHRQDANGVETYVVWDRCKVMPIAGGAICPDADVMLAASNDNGTTWHFEAVDTAAGDQYMPAIFTDPSTNIINIAYYSTQGDKPNHRPRVLFRQILPGPKTPDPVSNAQTITTTALEPSGDFFLGDRSIGNAIGIAARGNATKSHAYIHYMHNAVNGSYNGVPAPEQNNHLSTVAY
jgi:hypothetical protein